MKINQNISAVIVNDQLLRNENSVAASVKRLSSGFKFNDAKDNPSGMAISFKMQAQINALNRASLNATDGNSMVETIDGAMGEMNEVLQRIRELCVQAANETNGMEDLEAIQQEIDALKEEINRVSSATEFNGKTLLDGSLDRRTYVTKLDANQEKVSMFDQITNVIISDELQAGDYHVTIEKPAKHAALMTESSQIPGGGDVITEDMEGVVDINGAKAEIKAGMTADDVYKVLQDAGNTGWVNVFVTDGNEIPIEGYKEDTGGYAFDGKRLAFVSQNYGSDEEVTVACSNAKLADVLGISKLGTLTEKTAKIEREGNGNDPAKIETTTASAAANADVLTPDGKVIGSGTVYINNNQVNITDGMTAEQVYNAIATAAAGVDITPNTAAGFNFGDKLEFKMQNATDKLTITYENANMGKLFGFSDPALNEEIISIEYTAEAKGSNAEVSITDPHTGKNWEEYTGQAVVKTDGNQVVITDKSGFEMSFEVRGDVAFNDAVDITIQATDIGTLQLQIGANEDQEMAVRVPVLNTRSLYMDDLDVTKIKGADRGMVTMDKAISIVSAARSLMGAYENRLDYVKSGLDATEEDMTTAISRLGDVDMAQEMTEYTNANVLTQASISVLSQANDLPQQVLSLLQ